MPTRRGVHWCAPGLLAAALALLSFATASAQRDEEPETVILSLERGTIALGRASAPLPWARSSFGPLVALAPVVDVLGGDLEIGPLGEAHTLRFAGREVVLGPLSRAALVQGEVHNLSIRPWLEPERAYHGPEEDELLGPPSAASRHLFVPVDALARAYPETLGYRFDFDPRSGRLRVDRAGERRLGVEVERVHDLGATTLVVTFSNRPRFRVERSEAAVRLRLLSGVMDPRRRVRLNDPLVRWIEVRERSVDIGLASGAAASEPYLLGRPPRVQLVLDVTRRRPGRPPRATSRTAAEPRDFRIVLDPGHGGADEGVRSPSGESEKSLALGIAEALRSYLESALDVRVVLTRSGDSTVTLENRISLANQYEADLFVSLHVSAGPTRLPGNAFQTWVLDAPPAPLETPAAPGPPRDDGGATPFEDSPADELAAAETVEGEVFEEESREQGTSEDAAPEEDAPEEEALDDPGREEPADQAPPPVVLPPLEAWDRVHDSQLVQSELLAQLIQTQVSDVLDLPNRRFLRAPLRVLTGATMPGVLIEFGYEETEEEMTPVFDGARGREVFEAIGRAVRLYRGVATGVAEATARRTRS